MTTCIAYWPDGQLCGAPAPILDPQRGGYVCRLHQPDLPAWLSISPEGVLQFDVPAFIREAGLTDTPTMREDVTGIAAQILRQYFPGTPFLVGFKAP
ncbi:MAG: hypothetical protein ACREKK_01430 [Candidatus Methylomirabilales bacterium]